MKLYAGGKRSCWMNSFENCTHQDLLQRIKRIGEACHLPPAIAKDFFYGYLVKEQDKPGVYKKLTGQSLDLPKAG